MKGFIRVFTLIGVVAILFMMVAVYASSLASKGFASSNLRREPSTLNIPEISVVEKIVTVPCPSQPVVNEEYDVTMISQTGTERLFYIPHILSRWKGVLSLAIYIAPSSSSSSSSSISFETIQQQIHSLTHSLSHRFIPTFYHSNNSLIYPYNTLRNLAIQQVTTSHFVVLDMDMWPADNLYDCLRNLGHRFLSDEWLAVIVPSFELKKISNQKCDDFEPCVKEVMEYAPRSIVDLQDCLAMQQCDEFRKLYFVHNYITPHWYNKTISKNLLPVPCFKSFKQEPYVMVKRTSHLPAFEERFFNYGKDKISWIEELRYLGYMFAVLPNSFAVDIPHPRSRYAKQFFQHLDKYGAKSWSMNLAYGNWLKELHSKSPDRSIVYFCEESSDI